MFPHRIKFYKAREPDLATAMYLGINSIEKVRVLLACTLW